MDNKRKNPSILETNIFYLVLGTLLIFLGDLYNLERYILDY